MTHLRYKMTTYFANKQFIWIFRDMLGVENVYILFYVLMLQNSHKIYNFGLCTHYGYSIIYYMFKCCKTCRGFTKQCHIPNNKQYSRICFQHCGCTILFSSYYFLLILQNSHKNIILYYV